MKKVLILAYDFPPFVSVGGLRPFSWYKYLWEFDCYPVVVTRQWSNKHGNDMNYIGPSDSNENKIEETKLATLISTAYGPDLRYRIALKYGYPRFKYFLKGISAFYEIAQFLFLIGPKSRLFFAASEYLKKHKVDVILASGEPFVLFKYASKLSSKYQIPWIADYRDPWTQDKSRGENILRIKWDTFLEKKYVSTAKAIITVSSFLKDQIATLIKKKPIYIIPNGFDSDALEKVKDIPQGNNKLSIAFAGTIYNWHPVDSFLNVCCNFLKERYQPKFEIHFYGINNENEIRSQLGTKYPELLRIVKFYPKTPNDQLLIKLTRENILLLFNDYSSMGTKIYDYLALKRKIILCYSNDPEASRLKDKYYNMDEAAPDKMRLQEQLIKETKSGTIVEDAAHLIMILGNLYDEFKTNGFVACNSKDTEQFSRRIQAKNLCAAINNVV